MISRNELLKALRYLVIDRTTVYNNSFPYNCGYIHQNGGLSFDCIGLWKSLINSNCDIAYKMKPAGYYVQPGLVIPDVNEAGLLNLCSGISNNFQKIAAGEYLYMDGHAGVYVGGLFGNTSNVNVVECTITDYWPANGVVASWVDPDGTRRDRKGGKVLGRWTSHGMLSKYVNYNEWYQKNGEWYHATARGWLYDYLYHGWFYIEKDGKMKTGWLKDSKYWYYLCEKNDGKFFTGQMVTGKYNVPCYFDASGHFEY